MSTNLPRRLVRSAVTLALIGGFSVTAAEPARAHGTCSLRVGVPFNYTPGKYVYGYGEVTCTQTHYSFAMCVRLQWSPTPLFEPQTTREYETSSSCPFNDYLPPNGDIDYLREVKMPYLVAPEPAWYRTVANAGVGSGGAHWGMYAESTPILIT